MTDKTTNELRGNGTKDLILDFDISGLDAEIHIVGWRNVKIPSMGIETNADILLGPGKVILLTGGVGP